MTLPKIQHPTFSTEIPSTKKSIRYRPFTAREEKILLMAKQSGEEADVMAAIKQVVGNCVLTEGFDIDKLTVFDLEHLFIKVRIISVSNMVSVSYRDNGDNKIYNFDVDLEKVQMVWPSTEPPSIVLGDNMSMTLRWPTAELYTDAQLVNANGPDAMERLVAKCISKIFAGDQTYDPSTYKTEEVVEFIEDIPTSAWEEVRKFFDNMPHLLYVIEYKNSNGDDRRIELSALTDFFQFA